MAKKKPEIIDPPEPTPVDVATTIRELAEIGEKLDPKSLKNAAIGKLAKNMVDGVDYGNDAAHLIGKFRDVGLFETEQRSGVIVIMAPEGAKDLIAAVNKPGVEYLEAE